MSAGGGDRAAIVVGVDGSDPARAATAWAADLAAIRDVPLRLVFAGAPARGEVPVWLREIADAAAWAGATRTSTDVLGPVAAEDVLEILTEQSRDAGLLVIGSYGRDARSGMLAGSTALGLVARAACPVAVVRGSSRGLPPPRGGPVVAWVDAGPAAAAALDLAAALADSLGAGLSAVHTWSEVGVFDTASDTGAPHRAALDRVELAAEADRVLGECLEPVRDRHPALVVERIVVEDTPLRAMLDHAEHARLVVVGHRERRAADGMMLGSISRGLVEFAPCPVLVARTAPVRVVAG